MCVGGQRCGLVGDVLVVEVVHLHAGLGPGDRQWLVLGAGVTHELLRGATRDASEDLGVALQSRSSGSKAERIASGEAPCASGLRSRDAGSSTE